MHALWFRCGWSHIWIYIKQKWSSSRLGLSHITPKKKGSPRSAHVLNIVHPPRRLKNLLNMFWIHAWVWYSVATTKGRGVLKMFVWCALLMVQIITSKVSNLDKMTEAHNNRMRWCISVKILRRNILLHLVTKIIAFVHVRESANLCQKSSLNERSSVFYRVID